MRYDLVYSCDTLEHVEAPAIFFQNVFDALKPGGRAFISFPNEHPDVAHGITYFENRHDLATLIHNAGFAPERTAIEAISMSTRARHILRLGWYHPRRLAKLALGRFRDLRQGNAKIPSGNLHPSDEPQTFDQTDFFTIGPRLEVFSPVINAYCWGLLRLASRARPVFRIRPAPEVLWNTTLLLRMSR